MAQIDLPTAPVAGGAGRSFDYAMHKLHTRAQVIVASVAAFAMVALAGALILLI
jgi:hypothetical protein